MGCALHSRNLPSLRARFAKRRASAPRRPRFEQLEARALLATLIVNSPLDNITAGDGLVTLREAIIAANTNAATDLGQTGSGADTIQFDPVVFATPKTIALTFGEMIITEALTLEGPGQDVLTIDGQHNSRIFNITATSGNFTFRRLTITRGMTTGEGGAIRSEPYADSDSTLTVDECTVSNSVSTGHGGGIFTNSSLAVTNSNITGNSATGPNASGGGFHTARYRSVTVSGSTIADNSAAYAGGFLAKPEVTLTNSIVRNNRATGTAGGFLVRGLPTGGRGNAVVIDSVISGNTATGSGGGFQASYATVTGSTISDNTVTGRGGGISITYRSERSFVPESLVLSGSVVRDNKATIAGGGILVEFHALITNTVVANNIGGGIFTNGPLTLNSSTVTGNIASGPGGGISTVGAPGRPHGSGDVVLNNSTVQGNTSATNGGGIHTTRGNITLNSSTVSGNVAHAGGGVMSRHHSDPIYRGDVFLNASTVTGNHSATSGGGIYAGDVTLSSSTVSGNEAMTVGGGIYSRATASIKNSTVTGNRAVGGAGGGLWNGDNSIEIFESIVAANTAGSGGHDLLPGSGALTVRNSLVGDNAGTPLVESHIPDVNGNLIGSSAGAGVVNSRLGPLANNGGPTRTHALLAGSPAIDAIPVIFGPQPTHDYQLNGSLADARGGPSLVALGGTQQSTGYKFSANQGLNLSSALANPAQYSIEIVFRWDTLTGAWYKILDFHNLASDVGVYTTGNGFYFLDRAFAPGLFVPNSVAQIVITRDDATDIVRAYFNGVEMWSFVDSAGEAVFDGPNQIIRFFQDDTVTGQTQAQAGFVDRLRIYSQVLTAAEISAIIAPPPFTFPEFDQRGSPFQRVADGNGIGGAQMDMGAYESQVPLLPPAVDYGDAPDTGVGAGPGNYNTSVNDSGPNHTIVAALRLGASVDGESGTLQNSAANADDVNAALPDDEDGVSDPASDFVLTVGAQPTVNMRVTNTTGSAATLYGWIDYNGNGVFENATERASVAVPGGTTGGSVMLVFPAVPGGLIGTTYARFRLSTDAAAANPIGAAADGEVEDYRVTINRPATATADPAKTKKVASGTSGGPALANGDMFGSAVAALGDLDGDGIEDMAVGAPSQTGSGGAGAVFVQFMNADGTVKSSQRIASGVGGAPGLAAGDYFGHAVAAIGDLDGDGITDLAVGADKDDTGGYNRGAVYVLFLNANGTVKSSQKIAHSFGGGPALATSDRFGSSVTSLGDVDGDGVADLAVGAAGDDTGGSYRGAVYVLFLNAGGTVKSSQKIASGVGGGPVLADIDVFGIGVASLGDIDGDRVTDLAVGTFFDDTGGTGRGAVHVLFLNPNGTVKSSQKIASGGGGPVLADGDYFGRSVASLGDVDGDGVTDLAVGAYRDDTGGANRGALHVLLLNANGTVKQSTKIASGTGGGPSLLNDGRFGSGVAALGDLDGDGIFELAVGAETDNTGGVARGAAYVLSLTGTNTSPVFTSPAQVSVPENTTTVQTVTAIDAQSPPQSITYSIAGGADQSRFSITSAGVLSFITPPNFEAPTDAGGDNNYVVIVQASDGSLSSLQAIVVTVMPVNDNNPIITSPPTVTVLEGATTVMTLTATDADVPAQALTFSIVGGVDQSKFQIASGNVLRFTSPPGIYPPMDANGDNVYELIVHVSDGNGRTATQPIQVTVASLVDLGDAPDASGGSSPGNYNTHIADNGPRHTIVTGLRIGANVDRDNGVLQNATANADDVNAALPDDEEGVANPAADLVLTIGTQPTVNVRVTNTTGIPATLYAWIDYNANGVFDNATERSSVAVPHGANNSIVTLVFPLVPSGFTGTTYARFRLSTDSAAANPTGLAADGEVEDYRATVLNRTDPTVSKTTRLVTVNGQPPTVGNAFGYSLGPIGDWDGDGVTDLAVGAPEHDFAGQNKGSVYLFLMNANGTVKNSQLIAQYSNGGPPALINFDVLGKSVAAIGDLDGDGVTDLAVGAGGDDTGALDAGAVYVLFMNPNLTVKRIQEIASGTGGGPSLGSNAHFGFSVTSLGDLDGDGVGDMAVGAVGHRGSSGAVYVLFMNSDGTVKRNERISRGSSGARFGKGIASLGDMNGDGVTDLAVGVPGSDSAYSTGAVHVLFLNADGTVRSSQEISGSSLGAGSRQYFGSSVASLGDLDGDGVTDIAVGAPGPASGAAVYMLLLNANGTVKRSVKLGNGAGGVPAVARFGESVASLGDLDGDGLTDVAVGGQLDSGSVHILFLKPLNSSPVFTSPATASVPENTTAVMTVTVTDVDVPPQPITFSIAGGPDQARFGITTSGALLFNAPPDFDAPTDANGDNVYVVTVQANDNNGGISTQTISVTVTPINDSAPVFTSPDAVSLLENITSVLTVSAADADRPPQTITYSIVGGVDQAKFNITPGGALSFNTPPDFESPADSNGDNIYIVIVQASDGQFSNLQAIVVTVTNGSEVPLIGDYNNNGTVDLADYVLWRNGGPLQNEGTTPGVVTSEDYGVWRANFGRTFGAGSAEQGAGSHPEGTRQGVNLSPDTRHLTPDTSTSTNQRRDIRRPVRRNAFGADENRDDALVAWLASQADEPQRRSPTIGIADILERYGSGQYAEPSIAELDLAFAAH